MIACPTVKQVGITLLHKLGMMQETFILPIGGLDMNHWPSVNASIGCNNNLMLNK